MDRRTFIVAASLAAGRPAASAAAREPPLEAYERASGGTIGVYAENVRTGATIAWRAGERFVMCSTFKASLAALVLARVDRGVESLDERIAYGAADLQDYAPVAREHLAEGTLSLAQMCKAAVELSDNTCANLLLARVGGPAALTAFWRSSGDATSRLDHDEPVLNRTPLGQPQDTTTPAAMAGNLRRFLLGDTLSPRSRAQLTDWMLGCQTGADRLRAGLPKDWRVADKTGNNGKDAAGDIAVAWAPSGDPLLICVYTRGGVPTAAQLRSAFAAVGEQVARQLV